MKKEIYFGFLLLLICINCHSQVDYSLKAEIGYLKFWYRGLEVDPGPNWKGYNLDKNENGIDLNVVNGINYNNKLYAGLGIGYLNFKGIDGLSIFSDFEYLPLKTRLTPLINLKIGYSHIWNQYENGKGTALGELGFGLNYKLNESFSIYAKSGFLLTQQSLFLPIRLGIRF